MLLAGVGKLRFTYYLPSSQDADDVRGPGPIQVYLLVNDQGMHRGTLIQLET